MEPHRHGAPPGLSGHVADLARVPRRPTEQLAAAQHAAADADLARDEHHVVEADRGSATVLGEHPEVRLVGHRDGHAKVEQVLQPRAERDVPPAEVGRHLHEPVGVPDDPGDCHANADQRTPGRGTHRPGEAREVASHIVHHEVSAGAIDAHLLEHLAAKADDRRRDRVHEDLDPEDDGPVRDQADDGRRATRRALGDRRFLDHEACHGELADQPADGAPCQSGRRDELRAGLRTELVEAASDRGEVRPPHRLAPLAELDPADPQGLCSFLANLCQTRA